MRENGEEIKSNNISFFEAGHIARDILWRMALPRGVLSAVCEMAGMIFHPHPAAYPIQMNGKRNVSGLAGETG